MSGYGSDRATDLRLLWQNHQHQLRGFTDEEEDTTI